MSKFYFVLGIKFILHDLTQIRKLVGLFERRGFNGIKNCGCKGHIFDLVMPFID